MLVVAGAPGSGKSHAFNIRSSGFDFFNADDRAAELNRGSYQSITTEIRAQVNRELRQFIEDHVRDRKSFAFETTLRTTITFEQGRQAVTNGLFLLMFYVGVDDVETLVQRVANRVEEGGHPTSIDEIRET